MCKDAVPTLVRTINKPSAFSLQRFIVLFRDVSVVVPPVHREDSAELDMELPQGMHHLVPGFSSRKTTEGPEPDKKFREFA